MTLMNVAHLPATDLLWTLSSTAGALSDLEREVHALRGQLRTTRNLLGVVAESVAHIHPHLAGPFGLLYQRRRIQPADDPAVHND